MSLRFILGRAGTGKTHRCREEISAALKESPEGPPLILLVPEQATLQTERALSAFLPGKGLLRAQVLSFRRLAWRVLQEAGGITRTHIGEPGKQMLLRKILVERQGQWRLFSRVADRPGFVQALSEIIRELKNYRVDAGRLRQAASLLAGGKNAGGRPAGGLPAKLGDLILLYEQMEKALADRYLDPDDYLALLAGKIPASRALRGSQVWIDGFAGFTPQEYKVIEQLLLAARRVSVALCLDSRSAAGPAGDPDVFYPTRESLQRLQEMADRLGVPAEPPLLLDEQIPPRFLSNPALAHLEENFFRPAPAAYPRAAEGIKVVAAANRVAEVEGAAREIIALCREKGYRWREIAVVLKDLGAYQTLLRTIFSDYKIPFFIDARREVVNHPLVELIRSALEAIAGNWAAEPVFRYLKTDLVPVAREEVDLLENYVLAHGIKGARWYDGQDWRYVRHYTLAEEKESEEETELALINRIRAAAAAHLFSFQKALQKASGVREMVAALDELLAALEVPGQLAEWSKAALARGDVEAAREHAQVWGAVVDLFDQLVETLGDEKLSLNDFARIIETGLAGIRLGLIPPGLDQVLVGSLMRSRNPDVRACFVLGASDGVLPACPPAEGIFTDADRELLETAGIKLAPAGRRYLLNEQYLVYIALTRSSERLWLSYPLADEEGRAYAPSPVISRLQKIFPGLRETPCPAQPPGDPALDAEFIADADHTLSSLVLSLQEAKSGRAIPPVWWAAYNRLVDSGRCRRVLAGLFYTNQEKPLAAGTTAALYGRVLQTSISQCERYHGCRFAYGLAHALKLKERAVYKLQPVELGEFYHACLKAFAERIAQKGLDWGELTEEECRALIGEAVAEMAPRLKSEILLSSARHRFLAERAKKVLERAARVLCAHARRGNFRPRLTEVSFAPAGELPPLAVPLSGGLRMELSGRIDRVDTAAFEQNKYIRVIDYKTGRAGLSLSEIFYGLKLQLVAYLAVGQAAAKDALPAGIFYFPVADPVLPRKGPLPPAAAEEEILKELKLRGFVLADPQVARLMDEQIAGHSSILPAGLKNDGSLRANSSALDLQQFALLAAYLRELLRRTGEAILAGQMEINPYRFRQIPACRYCPYKPVCLFDLRLPENRYRELAELPGEEIWARIAEVLKEAGAFRLSENNN
ncbi:MAG: helicase-exonuclease AddAB subunit AddB [Bacillota bacterium]